MPSSSATRRFVVLLALVFSVLERSDAGFLKAFPYIRCWFAYALSASLHQSGASLMPNFSWIMGAQCRGTAVRPPDSTVWTAKSSLLER